MRILTLSCAACTLIALVGYKAAASDQQVAVFLRTTQRIAQRTDYPVLFVGRIVEKAPGDLPCTTRVGQSATYSVETVLFGFAPPNQVKVTYPKCGLSVTRLPSHDDLLVLAVPSGKDTWTSQQELTIPHTPVNVQKAQALLNGELKNRISEFMRYHGAPHHDDRVVAFEGTVRSPITSWEKPIPCLAQTLVPIDYDVEQVLYGDWTEKRMVVNIGICGNVPGLPILAGKRMIVFAAVSRSLTYGSLYVLIAPHEMAQVKAALGLR